MPLSQLNQRIKQFKNHNGTVYLLLIGFGVTMALMAAILLPSPSEIIADVTLRYSGVKLPQQYQTSLIHYATVQRPDGTLRDIYVNPQAIEALKMGNYGLPDNTVIVIDGYYALKDEGSNYVLSNGHYIKDIPFEMIHVLEKKADWAVEDFVNDNRIGDWNFGSFDMAADGYYDENMSACFHCHNATPQTNFLYSHPLLRRYALTGETQFFLCNLPDRIAC
jgi:hypothetical protein